MLLRNLDLLFNDPAAFLRIFPVIALTVGIGLIVAITVHEFSHSLIANLLGDPTSRRLGRLSLNPVRHLDPAGTLFFFLAGFGWGKPVPVNHLALRFGRRGMAAVAAAGPLSNVLAAFLFTLPFKFGLLAWSPFFYSGFSGGPAEVVSLIISTVVLLDIVLAVFNLLPVPPLDGSNLAIGLLPRALASRVARFYAYGPALLMAVIAIDMVTGAGILGRAINPVINYVGQLIVGKAF